MNSVEAAPACLYPEQADAASLNLRSQRSQVRILPGAPFDSPVGSPAASRQARSWRTHHTSNVLSEWWASRRLDHASRRTEPIISGHISQIALRLEPRVAGSLRLVAPENRSLTGQLKYIFAPTFATERSTTGVFDVVDRPAHSGRMALVLESVPETLAKRLIRLKSAL